MGGWLVGWLDGRMVWLRRVCCAHEVLVSLLLLLLLENGGCDRGGCVWGCLVWFTLVWRWCYGDFQRLVSDFPASEGRGVSE